MEFKKLDTVLRHPSDLITDVIGRIYKAGLTTTSGGNISIKDEQGNIWVTPSAVDKGSLTRKDIVCVKPDGSIKGHHKPSSEFTFHKAIFDARPDIKAVIHAHPPALVSFSIVRQVPNMNIIPQARQVCGAIGYSPYAIPGGEELGRSIAGEFEKGHNSVIMENHGAVIGGKNLLEAYLRFETFEFACRTIIGAKTIGEPIYLTDDQIKEFESQVSTHIPEFDDAVQDAEELSIRRNICKLVKRACNQGLMIGSYGTVSVRWHGNDFLITPTNVPRWEIDLPDIVQIRDGKREKGKLPSRAIKVHERIYRENPYINSIINTQAPNIMSFGVTNRKLDVRTIPESWVFLQDIPIVEFGHQFSDYSDVPDILNQNTPALIIQNDAILVTGDKLLQTFDRLEVAEFSAISLVMSAPLGELVPIKDNDVEDLRKKFL
ncbi:MAG TPA: class II aldolase/adducin family protein [Bacteroides sp.]|nr:class II aldolase/adducin family protein [Bacteroides sp.]